MVHTRCSINVIFMIITIIIFTLLFSKMLHMLPNFILTVILRSRWERNSYLHFTVRASEGRLSDMTHCKPSSSSGTQFSHWLNEETRLEKRNLKFFPVIAFTTPSFR